METPFVVLREAVGFQDPGIVSRVPLAQAFALHRHAQWIMRMALQGDPRARQLVERTFYDAMNTGPRQAEAIVYAYALKEALEAELAMRAQGQGDPSVVDAPASPPDPTPDPAEGGISDPNDVPSPEVPPSQNP